MRHTSRNRMAAVLAVLALLVTLCACGSPASPAPADVQVPAATPAPTAAPTAAPTTAPTEAPTPEPTPEPYAGIDYQYLTMNADGTRTFQDMKGATVTVAAAEEMDTILTVAWPGNQPTIALLGITDMVPAWMKSMQGEDYYWAQQYNPTILANPSLGSSAEELMTFDPDIVFTKTKDKQAELDAAGITAACMAPVTLDDVLHSVRLTAEISGRPEAVARADSWIGYYNEVVDMIRQRLANVPESEYPVVYVVNGQHGTTPLLTNGGGTLTETFSHLLGFKLATVDIVQGDATEITAEQLMALDPEYMIFFGMHAYEAYDALMADESLAGLSAVQNGKLAFVPKGGQPMNGTGVENVMYLQWQVKLLYPELFADIEMHDVVKDFYNRYMDYDISDAEIEAMLAGKNGL